MSSKSPLKSLKFQATLFAVAQAGFACLMSAAVESRPDMLLKRECNFDFGSFDATEREKPLQHKFDTTSPYGPTEPRGQGLLTHIGTVDTTGTVKGGDLIEDFSMDHSDLGPYLVGRGFESTGNTTSVDENASLAIKQSGEVGIFHQGLVKIAGELGGHPMPGLIRRGRAIPNQALIVDGGFHTSSPVEGVRNEQVLAPKGKVCSELGRNVETETETISGCMSIDMHANRNVYEKTCNVPVRFVRPGGQGGTADVTWESLDYMGRPWYWDRQCPAGRAYALQLDDINFMVDPRFLFKWTGDLTYPDQMAFTRLCGLRFFLKTDRRMFSGVFDGVTA